MIKDVSTYDHFGHVGRRISVKKNIIFFINLFLKTTCTALHFISDPYMHILHQLYITFVALEIIVKHIYTQFHI